MIIESDILVYRCEGSILLCISVACICTRVSMNTRRCEEILDNSGSDSRNLIGQLQVSKRGKNLERDSKCQWGGILSAPGT